MTNFENAQGDQPARSRMVSPVSYGGEFPRRKGPVRTRNKSQDDRMARSSAASLSGLGLCCQTFIHTPPLSCIYKLTFDHGRRAPTTEGAGRYPLLIECGH